MSSIEEGRQSDKSDEHIEKVPSSIRESLEPFANVTSERDSHREKQLLQSCSTEEGIEINSSEVHSENAKFSIDES
jgi:hypothetical protein